ncbi:MAG: hypothetical protein FWH55_03650 [Oscillospiraceae bacterium]|nr:hypothetical protein [Oscillospiraceae bacterium]
MGNLTYHYHKKESLFAEVYKELLQETHNRYLAYFSTKNGNENPWVTYVGVNYAHLYSVACSDSGVSSYIYSTRFPSARQAYSLANSELLLSCLKDTPYAENRQKIRIACMVGCGGEFEAMYAYSIRKGEYGFEQLITPTFSARLFLAGVESDVIQAYVAQGIQKGKDLLNQHTF